jgi:hypothetical protein
MVAFKLRGSVLEFGSLCLVCAVLRVFRGEDDFVAFVGEF